VMMSVARLIDFPFLLVVVSTNVPQTSQATRAAPESS
jgi:hypothetical protein